MTTRKTTEPRAEDSAREKANRSRRAEPTAREDYERLAQALFTMLELDSARQPSRLDVESPDAEDDDHALWRATQTHLDILFRQIDFYEPGGMRLYVEMRLLLDAQLAERTKRYEEYRREAAARDGDDEFPASIELDAEG